MSQPSGLRSRPAQAIALACALSMGLPLAATSTAALTRLDLTNKDVVNPNTCGG